MTTCSIASWHASPWLRLAQTPLRAVESDARPGRTIAVLDAQRPSGARLTDVGIADATAAMLICIADEAGALADWGEEAATVKALPIEIAWRAVWFRFEAAMLAIQMVANERREFGELPATPPLLLPAAICGGVMPSPAAG